MLFGVYCKKLNVLIPQGFDHWLHMRFNGGKNLELSEA